MRFRSYDALKIFDQVARRESLTAAAEALHLTKGAISYQIKQLEADLGFPLFLRQGRGLVLSERGKALWHASQAAFQGLDAEIARLRAKDRASITLGLSTYFASRWLSPRLMTFTAGQPHIALRLQPLTDLINLQAHEIDMAIRWGRGDWRDHAVESLFSCPAFPTAGQVVAERIAHQGLEKALPEIILLHDRDDSTAWADWHRAAGLDYAPRRQGLVIPDPNVRVQAVIDGQGLALNDPLVQDELDAGRLVQVSDVRLEDYGYFLVYPEGTMANTALKALRDWLREEAGRSMR